MSGSRGWCFLCPKRVRKIPFFVQGVKNANFVWRFLEKMISFYKNCLIGVYSSKIMSEGVKCQNNLVKGGKIDEKLSEGGKIGGTNCLRG